MHKGHPATNPNADCGNFWKNLSHRGLQRLIELKRGNLGTVRVTSFMIILTWTYRFSSSRWIVLLLKAAQSCRNVLQIHLFKFISALPVPRNGHAITIKCYPLLSPSNHFSFGVSESFLWVDTFRVQMLYMWFTLLNKTKIGIWTMKKQHMHACLQTPVTYVDLWSKHRVVPGMTTGSSYLSWVLSSCPVMWTHDARPRK